MKKLMTAVLAVCPKVRGIPRAAPPWAQCLVGLQSLHADRLLARFTLLARSGNRPDRDSYGDSLCATATAPCGSPTARTGARVPVDPEREFGRDWIGHHAADEPE
jgi:hypothetical protein